MSKGKENGSVLISDFLYGFDFDTAICLREQNASRIVYSLHMKVLVLLFEQFLIESIFTDVEGSLLGVTQN